MTFERRRDWTGFALNALRWTFVVLPLTGTVPFLTGWYWAVAATALIASVPLLWVPSRPVWLLPAGLITLAATSAALWLALPRTLMSIVVYTAVFYAARFLRFRQAAPVVVLAVATVVIQYLHAGHVIDALLTLAVVAAVTLLGLLRRDRQARIEQTELALARARTAAEEHAVAAALAERARIARELHDVLAHSLSGLALNLQAARLMLLRDGASEETVAQIDRARRLASDGLAEARKAVVALREDPVPLDRAITDLLAEYRLDTRAAAGLSVRGEAREVAPATGSTVLRAVQEALTNSRKHAPGAAVDVALTYAPSQLEVTVLDHQDGPVAAAPPGYGLRGMRERAELLGGRLSTGPAEDGWQVHLVVPA
jgi:signal transduction histidine kinase